MLQMYFLVIKVGFAAINIIGTPVDSAPSSDLGKSMKSALDGEGVLSEYDDISFLMYTDKEVKKLGLYELL